MTKHLECPLEGCHATIEAESEQAVLADAEEHAASSHPELELDEETVANIRASITDV